jgi:hypothetical protein
MMTDLVPGDLIFINDGIIRLFVKELQQENNCLLCEVEAGKWLFVLCFVFCVFVFFVLVFRISLVQTLRLL